MDKDRTRRYATASEFADDIARHLRHEPVVAGPPGATYRMGKFMRRNQGAVAASITLAVVLLAATGVSIAFAVGETEQRKLAELREGEANQARESEQAAKEEPQKRADELEAVTKFQDSMLSDIDAEEMGRLIVNDLRARARKRLSERGIEEVSATAALAGFDESVSGVNATNLALEVIDGGILNRAVGAIDREFPDQPQVQAQLLDTLGRVYHSLGQDAKAEPHLRRALKTRRKLHGDQHTDVATSLHSLAMVLRAKGDYEAAETLYREALAIFRTVLGAEHPHVALTLMNLAALLRDTGDYMAAEPLDREALAMLRKRLGEEHPYVALSLNNLASSLQAQGDYAAAEPLHREALALRRRLLGDEHPAVAKSLGRLAGLLEDKGDYAAAEPLFQEALAICEKKFPSGNINTAVIRARRGRTLTHLGRFAEAEALLLAAWELAQRLVVTIHCLMQKVIHWVGLV